MSQQIPSPSITMMTSGPYALEPGQTTYLGSPDVSPQNYFSGSVGTPEGVVGYLTCETDWFNNGPRFTITNIGTEVTSFMLQTIEIGPAPAASQISPV